MPTEQEANGRVHLSARRNEDYRRRRGDGSTARQAETKAAEFWQGSLARSRGKESEHRQPQNDGRPRQFW
ncbi:hypothetical protein AGIG_G16914 [Arapaima gigas]